MKIWRNTIVTVLVGISSAAYAQTDSGSGVSLDPSALITAFTADKAKKYLESQGFEQIEFYREDGKLRAKACADDRIHSIGIQKNGSLRSVRTEERCKNSEKSRKARFDPSKIDLALERQGYDRITILQGRRSPYEALVCRDGRRLRVSVDEKGQVTSTENVDKCRPAPAQEQIDAGQFRADGVSKFLRGEGYRRVKLAAGNGYPYLVTACKNGQLHQLSVGRSSVIQSNWISACPRRIKRDRSGNIAGFTPTQLPEILLNEGYDRITVLRDKRAPYRLRACKNGDRLDIRVTKRGGIAQKKRVGRCGLPIRPTALEPLLKKQGFSRIDVLQGRAAPYFANACRGADQVRLRIGRYGKPQVARNIGRCAGVLSKAAMKTLLSPHGFAGLSDEWSGGDCGEECASRTVGQVLRRLEGRGAESVQALVEGCYRGTKYRWEFDRQGNRQRRVAIGKCG